MPNEKGMGKSSRNGGHLYMQTNEVKNAIIHYHRSANTRPYSRSTGSSSSSAPRHRANSLLANNDLQWPVDWMGSPAGDPEC